LSASGKISRVGWKSTKILVINVFAGKLGIILMVLNVSIINTTFKPDFNKNMR
jgi:hypothetical protein